jgi:hypothetical protein
MVENNLTEAPFFSTPCLLGPSGIEKVMPFGKYICMYVCICVCLHKCKYMYINIYTYVCYVLVASNKSSLSVIYIYTCIYIYIYMYVYINIYTYIHKHITFRHIISIWDGRFEGHDTRSCWSSEKGSWIRQSQLNAHALWRFG